MIHVKTYENWLTNLFKSSEYSIWDEYMNSSILDKTNYNLLMRAADEGDLMKFKKYITIDIKDINTISNEGKNVLHYVVTGNGDISDKKVMIQMLIHNDIDYTIKFEGKTFYDLIEEHKLKNWFDKKYPDIVKDLNFIKDTEKYNL